MADINQSDVRLNVNNQEAKRSLDEVKKKLAELEAAWVKTATTGDKQMRDKLNKQIQATKRELRQMESGAKACERVFLQMNKATPNELRKALNHLQNELKGIERGSAAWNDHVSKIRLVKKELDKINAEMRVSENLLARMRNGINSWGMMLMGGTAGLFGLVSAGRKAVNAYASMDEQLANTRKYTGMTVEQVNELNEAFKKMSTRTSREELNLLAQEAGRLGKTTQEDVQGYVEAADIINVALVDLGEGATQTIAKMASIFRVDEEKGTRDAMLSVGSAVNVLSQNCTAGKQYLVDFTQRMAGVGSVSKMTIPEILAFGATLDANGQKCEMAASALGKLVMKLYQEPKEMARQVGLDVAEFEETLNRSTNEGVLMFLQRIKDLGSKDGLAVLAPMFKELGVDGVRMSQVMATLADKLEMVRWEQQEANKAFNEATSATNEYNIFNNTVQAGIDKARKRISELSVELGEKLLPVMKHVLTSTSLTLRALNIMVNFFIKYRIEILGVTAALAAYFMVMKAQAAWDAFLSGCQKAIAAVKAFNKALLSNPYAAAAALIVGIGIALAGYIKRQREAAKAADENRKALERQQEAEKRTASAIGEVIGKYQQLKSEWERLSSAQEKKEWLDKNRDAFEQLGLNIRNAVDADKAFVDGSKDVIEALKARAKAEALQDLYKAKMKEAYERALDEGGNKTIVDTNSAVNAQVRAAAGVTSEDERWSSYSDQTGTHSMYEGLTEAGAAKVNEYYRRKAEEDVARLTQEYTDEVESMYGKMYSSALTEAQRAADATGGLVGDSRPVDNNGSTTVLTPSEEELKKQHDAAIKEIEDWRKQENALNQIAYLQGEKDHCDYNERSHEIDVEYWQRRMAVEREGSVEYLEAKAKWLEAQRKQDEFYTKGTIEEEQRSYAELKASIDQSYADGKMSAKTYQLALEAAELDHLKAMVELYEEGSEERLKAQEAYQSKSLQYQRKHAEDARRIQERLQKEYFSNVGMPTNTASYEEEKLQLEAVRQIMMAQATADQKLQIEEAYQKAKYELAKKYNDEAGMMAVDAAQASVDKVLAYMKTDAFQGFYQSFSTLVSGMGEIFSGLTSLIDAETSLQEAQIEKKYEAEIAAAGNNKNAIARIEAEKEKEIAQMKNEAEEKKYAMQIASTIAQTAISAVNAYSSAAAIPVVGWIMGPIAAAMAVTAGGIQLATLKKEHEAAMAQGYAAGGYTMPGGKYQPAGIVHAGEWVASQELLANPTAAATIAQLDQAQRTNTIGQLDRQQVSASVSAPVGAARIQQTNPSNDDGLSDSIQKLNARLNEPFVNVNTVTGDKGTLRAQKRYEQLMRNKGKK